MNIGIIHPHIKSLNHYRVLLSSGELFSIHNTQATKQRKSPVNKPSFAFEKFSKSSFLSSSRE